MTVSLLHSLDVFSDGSVRASASAPSRPTFFRVKHDTEIGKIWRAGLPEVHPLYISTNPKDSNHFSPFQKWVQLVSFGLNPWFTPDLWTKIYHERYWIANRQGFGIDGDPRANFVTGQNTTKELPRVEALVTGGSMLEGVKIEGTRTGDWVKIKGLHYNTPATLAYLQAHPQFWVRGVYASGTGQPFRMLGHKYQGPALIHPLIVNEKYDCFIEAYKLQAWTSPEPPDPLRLYLV